MELTDEMMRHFRAVSEKKEAAFQACPPEALQKMHDRTFEDASAEYEQYWIDADVNCDGGLNEEEWINYCRIMYASSVKNYGWGPPCDEVLMKEIYQALITFTPHETGITRPAMDPWALVGSKVRRELAAKIQH